VTLHIKIARRKVKTCRFGSAKWFSIFAQFAEAGKMHIKAVHLPEKSVNEYELTAAPCF